MVVNTQVTVVVIAYMVVDLFIMVVNTTCDQFEASIAPKCCITSSFYNFMIKFPLFSKKKHNGK